ncbi:DUF192 domain-containing protein [Candidatus Woesearchaeota archaeon]|nr:MAG: hypothetical protein B6U93_03155 [Candidatus Woesearchaeota archaeon ex4484_78]RLE46529.1 MAG: DUF192 domain-containing protein [Candidatus Woesearchaeota archaeon]
MIKNITKKTVIAETFEQAKTNWQKTKGLMFRKAKPIVFYFNKEKKTNFHTWFVKEPIDIILLDKKSKVIATKENLKPWRFYNPKKKFKYAIEAQKGTIKKSKTEKGDTISITKSKL